MVVTFTDHLAVCLRIKLEAGMLQQGRGLWKMYTKILKYTTSRSHFELDWRRWRLQKKKKKPDMVTL